jgi:tetratricopeptide (TPR) repeat protein
MSEGFALLETDRLEDARGKFREALRIKPGSREAAVALEQAETRIRTTGIARLLAEAERLEEEERWAEAKEKYEAVLELDESMTVARRGRDHAATRAGIHDQLEQILAAPNRLFDRDVFEEMSRIHRTLSALSNPGKRLSAQLAALDKALKRADTPVPVRLISDNMTRVTVYKVGDLGTFTSRDLSLRPGHYVAVGRREGYQDERREFFVNPDGPMEPITIQADDRIALGS